MHGPSFSVGDIRCNVVPDGPSAIEPEFLFANIPLQAARDALAGTLDADGNFPAPHNPVLIRTPDAAVLVDSGYGLELADEWGEPIGRLLEGLEALGMAPEGIDVVVITHAHPDHIGGLTQSSGGRRRPVFNRARHLLLQQEWDYWFSASLTGANAEMKDLVDLHLPPVADAGLLSLETQETEVVPGVSIFPTPGHTPGHASVQVSAGGKHAIVAGDVVLHDLAFGHPDWLAAPEDDAELVVRTRRGVLERALSQEALFVAYHVEGVGRVQRDGEAFRFTVRPDTGER